ncbi:M67 family metallopeptidase [uncultured Selenomonas sp.]|uniref:M67 family metallopeptidase n=1 Tax=uncultured Selenomonas sp. TaxID=159275 RepID=UPI0025CDA04A|nr:M67 family metallopeptidase [uncultured Selenomonas sp.]
MATIVHLKLEDYVEMVQHARNVAPIEDCGLLGGTIDGDEKRVEKVFYLTNTDLRAAGWQLLGNWHSHPATPSRPSEEDKRLAFDSTASYFILSLNGGEPVLNSFHVDKEKHVTKEALRIH